jgi:hypothetical protein
VTPTAVAEKGAGAHLQLIAACLNRRYVGHPVRQHTAFAAVGAAGPQGYGVLSLRGAVACEECRHSRPLAELRPYRQRRSSNSPNAPSSSASNNAQEKRIPSGEYSFGVTEMRGTRSGSVAELK